MLSIWHIFIGLCLLSVNQIICRAKTIKKAGANLLRPVEELNPWQGKWFPYAPGEPHIRKLQRVQTQLNEIDKTDDTWQGKWFPYAPGEPHIPKTETLVDSPTTEQLHSNGENTTDHTDSWHGRWFPNAPNEPHILKSVKKPSNTIDFNTCDDGVQSLSVDYDPEDIRQNYNYLCLQNRSLYNPNLNTEGLLIQHFMPSAYMPPAKCLNESIAYTHQPATSGAFRPLPAVYGSYKYLPPQRYMRNLAEGAIVMLYHPCAYHSQVEQLKNIISGCLYRHIITPSNLLPPERPLALLAWRNSLSMSVVDQRQVAQFIRKYAKLGPLSMPNLSRVVERRDTYKAALLTEARLVTDLDDTELCGYLEQHM